MRRPGRWTLNALTALSFMLCIATAVLWPLSYFKFLALTVSHAHGEQAVFVVAGRLVIENPARWLTAPLPLHDPRLLCIYKDATRLPSYDELTDTPHLAGHLLFALGYGCFEYDNMLGGPDTAITVPFWWLLATFTVLPLRRRRSLRATRCASAGHCRKCRYDLTANLSGVCPECGTPIVKGVG